MLAVSALLLAIGAFAARSQPFFHRRDGAGEVSHLRSNAGDVLFGCHACRFYAENQAAKWARSV